ncbi:MAG: hypothetical protein HRT45_06255 [Bdellovibrionales bacterium]|nr:hypothetical protein [Bdellovibrionales bacterium]
MRYIRGNASHLGPLNWHHWVEKPVDGYYCLSHVDSNGVERPNNDLIDKHAFLMTNAGIDYIYIDISNWPRFYSNGQLRDDVRKRIVVPVKAILDRYSSLHISQKRYVSKIVFFMGLTNRQGGSTVWNSQSSADWLNEIYNTSKYRDLLYRRPGNSKPLLLVKTQNAVDDPNPNVAQKSYRWANVSAVINNFNLGNKFEIIPMWANINHHFRHGNSSSLNKNNVWSYVERCRTSSGNIVQDCDQRRASLGRQIAVAPAAKNGSALASDMQTRRNGRTFCQQFRRASRTDVDTISLKLECLGN